MLVLILLSNILGGTPTQRLVNASTDASDFFIPQGFCGGKQTLEGMSDSNHWLDETLDWQPASRGILIIHPPTIILMLQSITTSNTSQHCSHTLTVTANDQTIHNEIPGHTNFAVICLHAITAKESDAHKSSYYCGMLYYCAAHTSDHLVQ